MKTVTKEIQERLTPEQTLDLLKEGNERFVSNVKALRDLQEQVTETSTGQYPFAAVLGCIDSRVPAELVFDLGIGDIFNVRVAGNIVNEDVLGSLEYACKVAGSKLIVVLGHTKCGAVAAACNHVELGNITPLLEKIKPAIAAVENQSSTIGETDPDEVAVQNVQKSIEKIRSDSNILADMEENGSIKIVGAMYDVATGKVTFYH